jgi:hypothetical protein
MNTPENTSLKTWTTPAILDINSAKIKQEISQQDAELLSLLASDENSFRLLSGSTSDYRLKNDSRQFSGLEILNRLKVYDFAWKGTGQREFGVMAHELQEELPYMVTGQRDEVDAQGQPIIQRVNYAKLVPVLLQAIQEQQKMIDSLRHEVDHLAKEMTDSPSF